MTREPVEFEILGPLRILRAGAESKPGSPQETALLALLLARAGQPVGVTEMVDALWGERPPDTAVNVLHRHVGALRRRLEPELPPRAEGRWLLRGASGYRLATDAASLDLLRFRGLRERARQAGAAGSAVDAVALHTRALSLWRGSVAAGLPARLRAYEAFRSLDRERLDAVQEAADVALHSGVPHALLDELRARAAENPLHEPLSARLILALAATGHRAEELTTYDTAAFRLSEELGIDPGQDLREARRAALDGVPVETVAPRTAALPTPAQLPHDLPTFVGRRTELHDVLAASGSDPRVAGTVMIAAISGMAGVGKTTLAVHLAHQVADRFPDGQLYVNLRGFDPSGTAVGAGEAVRGFLDALGVAPDRVPHGLDAQAALYRSLLAGRRFLVLLDNARDSEHVRPLLPASSGCLAIVTSRDRLAGLVAGHGARSLALRPLDSEEAVELLVRRLGAERVAAEPGAVAEISALCAGLPLALACVAARAAAHPQFALSAIAAELRAARGSLDAFASNDRSADVGAVFSWSSRALSPAAARLFGLLGLHPGPEVTARAAAALAGLGTREAGLLLAELSRVHLINEQAPGRYAFHDLLRAHAAERADAEYGDAHRREAVDRLFAHYLHTAHAANLLIAPYADGLPLGPAPAGCLTEPLAGEEEALAWLAAEYPVLLAVVDAAAGDGSDRLACLLVSSLERFFDRRGHWHDWAAVQSTALDAARRLSDPVLQAHGLRGLARVAGRLGLHDEAGAHLDGALDLFTELGDDIGRATVHRSLAWESERRGDLAGALRHDRLALDLLRAGGGPAAAQASALNAVGWSHSMLGDHEQALAHCTEALAVLERLGDRVGQAATWDSIAYAHHHLGRHREALASYRNALAVFRDLGVPAEEAGTLTRIGDTHDAMGDPEAARTAWRAALTLLAGLDHPDATRLRSRLEGADEQRSSS